MSDHRPALDVFAPDVEASDRRDGPTASTDHRREEATVNTLVRDFIRATNAFDVEAALRLFAADAVIEDASVGDTFVGAARIRAYLETYFVRHHTVTTLISSEVSGGRHVEARVEFTGDFGHETGVLKLRIDTDGRIERIDADLE